MIFQNNKNYFSKRLVHFKGGGSDSVDEVYNAGMLELSEHQQEMADELFAFYKHGTGGAYETKQVEVSPATTGQRQVWHGGGGRDGFGQNVTETYDIPATYEEQQVWVSDGTTNGYMDMEQGQIDANIEMMPYETASQKSTFERQQAEDESALSLIPGQTALAGKQLGLDSKLADYAFKADKDAARLTAQQARGAIRLLPNQENLAAETTAAARSVLPGQTKLTNSQNEAALSLIPGATALSSEQTAATRSLLPGQTALSGEKTAAERSLIPGATALSSEQTAATRSLLPGQTALSSAKTASEMSLLPGQTDLSREKTAAERSLLPGATALSGAQTSAAMELLPGQTALTAKKTADESALIDQRAPVRQAFYADVMDGVNVEERANRAAADAAHAFMNSNQTSRRESARMGVNPNSGRFQAMQTSNNINRAKAIGGARTQARTQAENDKFGRLKSAMGVV